MDYPAGIQIINASKLYGMLYNEEAYVKEFAEAAVQSFDEFSDHYEQFLLARNEEKLRRAGHKIKPVALMLDVQVLVEEYEKAKKLLWDEKAEEELKSSVNRMNGILTKIQSDLALIIGS